MLVYIVIRHVLGDEVHGVCITAICEATHDGLFLLDKTVDMHPSVATFLSDNGIVLHKLMALITFTFMDRSSTLRGLFDGVLLIL